MSQYPSQESPSIDTRYAPQSGGYHERQGYMAGSPTESSKHSKLYIPNSTWTWAFLAINASQAVIGLALEAYVFGYFETNLPHGLKGQPPARAIPTYLSLFIFGFLYELFLVWDALRLKNTIQIIGLCIYNVGLLVEAAVQYDQIHDALAALNALDSNINISNGVRPYIIAVPSVIGLGTMLMSFVAWKLYEEFAWTIYKQISADVRLRRMYLSYQVYIALLKFDFFFFLAFTVQFLVVVPRTPTYEQGITIAALPITACILFLAAYWTRQENRYGTALTIVLYLAGMAYFLFKLIRIYDSPRKADYHYARKSLTTFAVFSIGLLVITIVYASICTHNFGKGLKQHLNSMNSSSGWRRSKNGGEELSKLNGNSYASTPLERGGLEVLENAAKDGSFDVTQWPQVLGSLIARLEEIVHNEFPIPSIVLRPNGASGETFAHPQQPQQHHLSPPSTLPPSSPPLSVSSVPPLPQSSESSLAEQPPPTIALPQHTIPPPQLATLTYIKKTLSANFTIYPPHTIQRLSELILHPKQHYRFLHSYLNALDRVVSVSSPTISFPLPGSETSAPTITDVLVNGTSSSSVSSPSSSFGSDESLGGALLTPIPWLQKRRGSDAGSIHESHINGVSSADGSDTTSTDEDTVMAEESGSDNRGIGSLREQGGITQGELLREEQVASDPPVPIGSAQNREHVTDAARVPAVIANGINGTDVNGIASGLPSVSAVESVVPVNEEQHELPHARGPEEIGPEDTGNFEGGQVLDMNKAVGRPTESVSVTNAGATVTAEGNVQTQEEEDDHVAVQEPPAMPQIKADKGTDEDVVLADADGLTDEDRRKLENTGENVAPDAVDTTGR